MSEETEIARQWLAKAASDLLNADNNLKAEKIPYDTVCFHCQQAAEKMLKAYLVARGKDYPISHDLLLILEQVLSLDPKAEKLRDTLIILMSYAVEVRYPDYYNVPSAEDTHEARKAAEKVHDWLKQMCPGLFNE